MQWTDLGLANQYGQSSVGCLLSDARLLLTIDVFVLLGSDSLRARIVCCLELPTSHLQQPEAQFV